MTIAYLHVYLDTNLIRTIYGLVAARNIRIARELYWVRCGEQIEETLRTFRPLEALAHHHFDFGFANGHNSITYVYPNGVEHILMGGEGGGRHERFILPDQRPLRPNERYVQVLRVRVPGLGLFAILAPQHSSAGSSIALTWQVSICRASEHSA